MMTFPKMQNPKLNLNRKGHWVQWLRLCTQALSQSIKPMSSPNTTLIHSHCSQSPQSTAVLTLPVATGTTAVALSWSVWLPVVPSRSVQIHENR